MKSGTTPRGSYLRAAAASVDPTRAYGAVAALLNAGADPNDASEKGTRATHIAAARGNAAVLEALLDAGAFAGAKDFDKQTILHLAVRSGDVATTRVAAHACACLRTREGGLESWDRWKRTAGAWALRFGDAESLSILRDAGAKLTGLERDVSEYTHGGVTHHGELSERSEVQMRSRPARKRGASAEVIEALTRRLDETRRGRRDGGGVRVEGAGLRQRREQAGVARRGRGAQAATSYPRVHVRRVHRGVEEHCQRPGRVERSRRARSRRRARGRDTDKPRRPSPWGAGDAWTGMPGGRCSPRGVRCGR